jgi:hypothetical protein
MKIFFSSKEKIYLEGLFLSIIMFLLLSREIGYILPNVFNLRDYLRIQEIINGHPIFYGPELSKNGNIPGAFYYYFLLIPFKLGGFMACAYLMYAMSALVFGLSWIFFELKNIKNYVFIATLFLISHVYKNLRDMVWNPSFLPLFWVIIIFLLYEIYHSEKVDYNWYLLCIIASLAMQIHMSSIFWILIGSFFAIRNVKKFTIGILLFFIPILPYVVWLVFFNQTTKHLNYFQSSWDASNFFIFLSQGTFSHFSLGRVMSSFTYFFQPLFLIMLAVGLVMRGFLAFFQKNIKILKLDLYFISCILGIFLFILPVLITRDNPRYLFLPELLGLIYLSYVFNTFVQSSYQRVFTLTFGLVLFYDLYRKIHLVEVKDILNTEFYLPILLLCFFVATLVSRRLKYISTIFILYITFFIYSFTWHQQTDNFIKLVPLHAMESISEKIFDETHWSPEEFNQRLFWVGVLPEFSMNYVYKSFYEKNFLRKAYPFKNVIDGYIIIHQRAIPDSQSHEKFSSDTFWQKWIKEDRVKIVSKSQFGKFTILSYQINDKNLPVTLQNTGLSNSESEVYLEKIKADKKYSISTFEGKGPIFTIIYKKETKELVFFSRETSRIYTLGPNIIIKKGKLRFLCKRREKELTLPDLGPSVGTRNSDLYMGFSNPNSYFRSTLFTPLRYRIEECVDFKPLEFSAETIEYFVWGRKSAQEQISKNFTYKFSDR